MNYKKFQTLLKDESWDSIYNVSNVNEIFNNFQYTVLRYFETTSFPISYIDHKQIDNNWITRGIRIFCRKKRELYSIYRNNKVNILIKDH
jgi:hypothetical protein